MPVVLVNFPIVYHATPKVACTSIKLALYELDHGKPFVPRQLPDGKWLHIHTSWHGGTPLFIPVDDPSRYKFAVVRDPVQRFLSAYANRVLYHGELSEKHLSHEMVRRYSLTYNPTISQFVRGLEGYRRVSLSISHHTDLQTAFIGSRLSYYDRVFEFSELGKIAEELKDALGVVLKLPHEQSGGPKLKLSELSEEELETLVNFYAQDYHLLRGFYQPPIPIKL